MGLGLKRAALGASVAAWAAALLVIHDLGHTDPATLNDATAWARLGAAAGFGAAAYGAPLLVLVGLTGRLRRARTGRVEDPLAPLSSCAGLASALILAVAALTSASERHGAPAAGSAAWALEAGIILAGAAACGSGTALLAAAAGRTRRPRLALLGLASLPVLSALPAAISIFAAAAGAGPQTPSSAAPPEAPDIILIVADSVRADALGDGEGQRLGTPALQALAERGVRFSAAHAATSRTAPSAASILTGLLPSAHGLTVPEERLVAGAHTLASALHERGYATAAIIASPWVKSAMDLSRGFDTWDEDQDGRLPAHHRRALFSRILRASGLFDEVTRPRPASRIVDAALKRLSRPRGQPLFLYLHLADARDPYDPPEDLARRADEGYAGSLQLEPGTLDRILKGELAASPVDLAHAKALYEAEVAAMDREIGRLLAVLEGPLASGRALAVFTSSHGEEFMDHGSLGHGRTLYQESVHVPLLIAGGALAPGTTVEMPVSLLDLPATLIDLAGLPPGPGGEGRSLAAAARGGTRDAGPAPTVIMEGIFTGNETGALRAGAARRGSLKVILSQPNAFGMGPWRREAFDLGKDPEEASPLAVLPKEAERLESEIRSRLGIPERRADAR